MTKRVVFIGGPGCGKSTLTADVFVAFKKIGKVTEFVPEWIRREIMREGVMTSVWEQYRTMNNHRREELHFPDTVEYLILDGGTLTPYFYTAVYSKKDDRKERLVVQDMYEQLLDDLYSRKYDHIYFLPRIFTDQAGVSFQDGTRFQTDEELDTLEQYMSLIFTKIHRMDNIKVLNCPLDDRVDTIVQDVLGDEGTETWKRIKGS